MNRPVSAETKHQAGFDAALAIAQAEQLGANAVINVRFSTSAVTAGAAEIYAYGTAVTAAAV